MSTLRIMKYHDQYNVYCDRRIVERRRYRYHTYRMYMMFNMLMHSRIKVTGLLDGFSCFAYRLPAILYHPPFRALASLRRVQGRRSLAYSGGYHSTTTLMGLAWSPIYTYSVEQWSLSAFSFIVGHLEIEINSNVTVLLGFNKRVLYHWDKTS